MSGAYYNDNDPFCAAWVRELMKRDLIAPGEVDERSIEDVQPEDVKPFTQAHFFCGIAGWSLALRLAGWPDDRPVWTGSCPCQPVSEAGQGMGTEDSRHLWPKWYELIRERKPVTVFGEQVASKYGLAWFDTVSADLEAAGYISGAVDLCAAGVGAPHARQRLFFVSHAASGKTGPTQSRNGNRETEARSPHGASPIGGSIGLHGKHDWNTEPSICRVAHGLSVDVARISAFGNAIVPDAAAAFIQAYMSL